MHLAASLLAAVVPMLIYLVLIWYFDSYDREPFGLVLKNYLWGGLGAIILSFIGSSFINSFLSLIILNSDQLKNVETIIVAPVVEESMKGLFLLITVANKKFDNMTDGIVYGGAIGLGFGMTENFLYFMAFGTTLSEWVSIVIIRTLFSAVMHCVSTATFGAFLGYAKFKNIFFKLTFPFIGLGIAMFIHFAWNLTISFQSTAVLGFLFMFVTIIIFIIVYIASIRTERKIIHTELEEEVRRGIIPEEHLQILNSAKRNKSGWVDESIRKLYIRAATTLAFRKMQLKNSVGLSRTFYEHDIQRFRTFIFNLLNNVRQPEQ